MGARLFAALLGLVILAAAADAKVLPGSAEYRQGVARYKANDFPAAVLKFRAAAKLGHPGGLYQVGKALVKGQGVKKNPKKGRAWIRKAAKLGHPKAKLLIAKWAAMGAAKETARASKARPAVSLVVRDQAAVGEMEEAPPVSAEGDADEYSPAPAEDEGEDRAPAPAEGDMGEYPPAPAEDEGEERASVSLEGEEGEDPLAPAEDAEDEEEDSSMPMPAPDGDNLQELRSPTDDERDAAPGVRQSLEAQNEYIDEARVTELQQQAEAKIAWSTFHLAFLYEGGVGVEKDLARAKELYELAARRGYVLANVFLEDLSEP